MRLGLIIYGLQLRRIPTCREDNGTITELKVVCTILTMNLEIAYSRSFFTYYYINFRLLYILGSLQSAENEVNITHDFSQNRTLCH